MRALLLRHGESVHNAHTGSGEPLADAEGDLLTERASSRRTRPAPGCASTASRGC